jgi:hypothetical protein
LDWPGGPTDLHIFSNASKDQTTRSILTHDGSNNAALHKEVPLGFSSIQLAVWRSYPLKTSHFWAGDRDNFHYKLFTISSVAQIAHVDDTTQKGKTSTIKMHLGVKFLKTSPQRAYQPVAKLATHCYPNAPWRSIPNVSRNINSN